MVITTQTSIIADAVHDAGTPLTNCFEFIDGTVRPICPPGEMYIGIQVEKEIICLKMQSAVTSNDLIANSFWSCRRL